MKKDKFLENLFKRRDKLNKALRSNPSYPSSSEFYHLAELDAIIIDYKKFANEKDSN